MPNVKHGPNRQGLERSLEALAVGPQHDALVEAARALADVVDTTGEFDDKMWREYRLVLALLMEATADDGADDWAELEQRLASLD